MQGVRRGDMTEGNIWTLIVRFSIPLLLGNVLQQLYSAFDAIIVGHYVSREALAAVGASAPLINMIIAFFIGLSLGASVLIAQSYGAGDAKGVQETVHVAMLLSMLFGIALSVAGVVLCPHILVWMQTPPEILPDAVTYLRIYFGGLTALTVYNVGTAILTATGDSKKPLYFLIVSSLIHIAGDFLFVTALNAGVAGVAWSTVLSQGIAAALVLIVLCRANTVYKLRFSQMNLSPKVVKRIAAIGLPGGIQQAIISLSNIVVQAYINGLGAVIVSGYSASNRIDAFVTLPAQTLALAVSTFVGQNLGAGKVARARAGTRNALALCIGVTALTSVVALSFGRFLLGIFSPDPQVIEYGYQFMWVFVPFYLILAFTQVLPGALRGAGDVKIPTLICIVSFVGLRQVYLFFATQFAYTIPVVGACYPITWAIAAAGILLYYRRSNWDSFARREEEQAADRREAEGRDANVVNG